MPSPSSELRVLRALSPARSIAEVRDARHIFFLGFALRSLRHPFPSYFLSTRSAQRDLAGLEAPTFVVLARHDIFAPGNSVQAAVRQLFGHVSGVEVLVDTHVLSENSRSFVHQRVGRFLRDER